MIIGDVEVEVVQLVPRHPIDDHLDLSGIQPVARRIRHHATVPETRLVLDVHGPRNPRHTLLCLESRLSRQELKQGLVPPEKAGVFASTDFCDVSVHVKRVFLVLQPLDCTEENAVTDIATHNIQGITG